MGTKWVPGGGPPDCTLAVAFNSGELLSIYDSEQHYESYQVHLGDDLIVV